MHHSRCSLSGRELVGLIQTVLGRQIVAGLHAHEGRVHLVALLHILRFDCGASQHGLSLRAVDGDFTQVVAHVPSHGRQLQAADHTWPAAALGANIVTRRVLVLQVPEVARQNVRAWPWGHYNTTKTEWVTHSVSYNMPSTWVQI